MTRRILNRPQGSTNQSIEIYFDRDQFNVNSQKRPVD
jgi:hypothetical protein